MESRVVLRIPNDMAITWALLFSMEALVREIRKAFS